MRQLNKDKSGAASTSSVAAIMRTLVATIIAVIFAHWLISISNLMPDTAQHPHIEVGSHTATITVLDIPVGQTKPHKSIEMVTEVLAPKVAAEPLPPPEPPKPEPWAVSVSPHGKVPVTTINTMLAHLQARGLTKEGAAYLTGNFIAESYLIPCGQYGDGGMAHGFAQWHPGRRVDMPCGFIEQLDWALDVEMMRDTPELKTALYTSDIAAIQYWLKRWERYGVEGNRWQYAASVYSQL